jgi:magnesium chelatase subunit D
MNQASWDDAQWALLALQVDPVRLGGVWLKAGHGPVRDAWLKQVQSLACPVHKVPHHTDDDRLLGGIDLTASLSAGRLVSQTGLLTRLDGGLLVLPMAERFPRHLLAILLQIQEQGTWFERHTALPRSATFGLLALDESHDEDTPLPQALSDRLALWLDLTQVPYGATDQIDLLTASEVQQARNALKKIAPTGEQIQAMCHTAQAFGVGGLRAPSWAMYVAALHAALDGREAIDDDDLQSAVRLVLIPRATQLPAPEPQEAPPEQPHEPPSEPPSEPPDQQDTDDQEDQANSAQEPELQDQVLAAALASLPQDVLDKLMLSMNRPKARAASVGQSGQKLSARLRGRPLSPRPGHPHAGARLHVLATLRAAAPKQRLRTTLPGGPRVAIRSEDFHVHRFEQRSASCLIFALDASGSAAYQRLAEAKGAVEILLQQSYARRDSVCVIAFRGAQAQVLLPPTRSLVRAKKALSGLPGGGGTPMALALQTATQTALSLQRQGTTPTLVVLSDGRANVTLAGMGGRTQAQAEAMQWATQWRLSGFTGLWIDTSPQPDAQAQGLAQAMAASYFPMPHVQAQRMAAVVQNLTS